MRHTYCPLLSNKVGATKSKGTSASNRARAGNGGSSVMSGGSGDSPSGAGDGPASTAGKCSLSFELIVCKTRKRAEAVVQLVCENEAQRIAW